MLEMMLRDNFFPCLLNSITVIYIIMKLLKEKINLKSPLFYLMLFCLTMFIIYNYKFVDDYIRILTSTFITLLFSYIIFESDFSKIVFATIIEQIVLFISEFIFAIIVIVLEGYNLNFSDIMGTFSTTLIICFIAVILINIPIFYRFCIKLLNIMIKIKYFSEYLIVLFLFLTLNVLLLNIYTSNNWLILLVNATFIIIYSLIVYLLMNEKNKNLVFKKENQALINNLNEYEKMLDYQRVNNHENKNQLLIIKSMIEKKDKKTLEYINEIIKDKREDNDILYTKAKRIPSGGLQGLIYQKMLYAEDKSIKFNLDISTAVRKLTLFETDAKLNYDICRIIGIILDNAIEETVKLPKEEREVLISMYVDDCFNIEISNHFVNDIDINKIFNKGYTTKAEGHGYGLTLLKQIVDSNDNIINEVKVINGLFIQIIKIKM